MVNKKTSVLLFKSALFLQCQPCTNIEEIGTEGSLVLYSQLFSQSQSTHTSMLTLNARTKQAQTKKKTIQHTNTLEVQTLSVVIIRFCKFLQWLRQ